MEDERDNSEHNQDVNEKAGDVKEEEATAPGQDQKNCKKKPHDKHLVIVAETLP
jgi:hypothetical protein